MLDGYKTYLAGISAFLIALGVAINDYISGGVIDLEPVILSLVALAIIFLRQGFKTEVNK